MVLAMHCFGQQLVGANYELSRVVRGKLQEIDIEQVLTLLSPPPLPRRLTPLFASLTLHVPFGCNNGVYFCEVSYNWNDEERVTNLLFIYYEAVEILIKG